MPTPTRRLLAGWLAVRLPFGVGQAVREHSAMRERLRQLEWQHSEYVARAERAAGAQAERSAIAQRRLIAAAMGGDPVAPAAGPDHPKSLAGQPPGRAFLRRLRDQGRLLDRLLTGAPLEDAVVEFVRSRLRSGDHRISWSLAQSLQRNPATRVAGNLGSAVLAARDGLLELAWSCLREVPAPVWQRLAAPEYFRAGFAADPEAAIAEAAKIIDDPPGDLPPPGWVDLAKAAFGAGELALAANVLAAADAAAARAPADWVGTDSARDWLRRWLDPARPVEPPIVPPGRVPIAVLGYHQPDRLRTSSNLGDYLQTLASLGHLARHRNLRYHGPAELVELLAELPGRVPAGLRLETTARDVQLVPVSRDASNHDLVPDRTWLIACGWYMHNIFGRLDFPPHPHLRPIFLSFHCNRPEILTPAAIAYLQAYGPVGCRDWTTVDILLSAGVPAFFSGCLTTTTDLLFPERDPPLPATGGPVAYVDAPAPDGAAVLSQETREVREADLVTNLRAAIDRLEAYRSRYSAVVTSRLHCYLPARSIGAAVEFRPANPADIRFNGLTGLDDAAYAGIRQGILGKLERVLTAILTGAGDPEVYAIWREMCAPEVAAARVRHAAPPALPARSFDIAADCARIRAGQVRIERSASGPGDPQVHVVLALDGSRTQELPVVLEAMAGHASRSLHLWILCRGCRSSDYRQVAALFPAVSFSWLPCDGVDNRWPAGPAGNGAGRGSERLLLPELLPELDRAVYHDIDALPLADISVLYDWDLQGAPLAARSMVAGHAASGFGNVLRHCRRMDRDPSAAYDCLRQVCARHTYDFTAFDAGILVLDLARMRSDGFCQEFVPFAERCGMDYQDVLNCYAGPQRAALPPEWNSFPGLEVVEDPRVIHWAGPMKPWDREYVALREQWAEYADRLTARAAPPPVGLPGRPAARSAGG